MQRGFSLFEVVLVVAIAGLLAAAVGAMLARSGPRARVTQSLDRAVTELASARLSAMRTGKGAEFTLWVDGDTMRSDPDPGEAKEWRAASVVLQTGLAPQESRFSATFGPSGRTDERRWTFVSGLTGDTIWAIEFDPISGVPRLRPPDRTTRQTASSRTEDTP